EVADRTAGRGDPAPDPLSGRPVERRGRPRPARPNVDMATCGYGPSRLRLGHVPDTGSRSEEHTSEHQSREKLVCRLLLETTNDPDIVSGTHPSELFNLALHDALPI